MADFIETVRELFREYAAQTGMDLCFQSFDRELATLPGDYAAPAGRLHVAYQDDIPAACVGLRPLSGRACELKRLYVRPPFRRSGLGRSLVDLMIAEARAIGYRSMFLDTHPSMEKAIALYRRMGFREIPPYRSGQPKELVYMEFNLDRPVSPELAPPTAATYTALE